MLIWERTVPMHLVIVIDSIQIMYSNNFLFQENEIIFPSRVHPTVDIKNFYADACTESSKYLQFYFGTLYYDSCENNYSISLF